MAIWSVEIKELEKLCKSHKGQLPNLDKELERLVRADDREHDPPVFKEMSRSYYN